MHSFHLQVWSAPPRVMGRHVCIRALFLLPWSNCPVGLSTTPLFSHLGICPATPLPRDIFPSTRGANFLVRLSCTQQHTPNTNHSLLVHYIMALTKRCTCYVLLTPPPALIHEASHHELKAVLPTFSRKQRHASSAMQYPPAAEMYLSYVSNRMLPFWIISGAVSCSAPGKRRRKWHLLPASKMLWLLAH